MGFETVEGVQFSRIIPQFSRPELVHFLFRETLEGFFGGGNIKKLEGVGEVVLVADFLDLSEPRLGVVRTCGEDMLGNLMEDVVLKSTNHGKESKLPQVESDREGQGARNEVCR